MDARRQVDYQLAKEYADGNNMNYYECSAKSGYNVESVFLELAGKIKERVIVEPEKKGKIRKFSIFN